MSTVELPVSGPFSLRESIRFLEGFPPARYRSAGDPVLQFAAAVEGGGPVVRAAVRQPRPDLVVAEVEGSVPDRFPAQLARILSVDVDGTGYVDVLGADPVLAGLAARRQGLRPVCFWSPYEAACYAVLSQRTSMTAAASVKQRIAEEHGERCRVDGLELTAFPDPARLRAVAAELPVPEVKAQRLRGVAEAALDGVLDGDRLRAVPVEDALAAVRAVPGIGPFSAELVVVRGAGAPDVVPRSEGRLLAAMRDLYRLPSADADELARVAARWAPYRGWVSVLLRSSRERGSSA